MGHWCQYHHQAGQPSWRGSRYTHTENNLHFISGNTIGGQTTRTTDRIIQPRTQPQQHQRTVEITRHLEINQPKAEIVQDQGQGQFSEEAFETKTFSLLPNQQQEVKQDFYVSTSDSMSQSRQQPMKSQSSGETTITREINREPPIQTGEQTTEIILSSQVTQQRLAVEGKHVDIEQAEM